MDRQRMHELRQSVRANLGNRPHRRLDAIGMRQSVQRRLRQYAHPSTLSSSPRRMESQSPNVPAVEVDAPYPRQPNLEEAVQELTSIMRRLAPSHHGRLCLEKVFYLNSSKSKRLSVGLDLERHLQVHALIEGNNGVRVRLSSDELKELLSEQWRASVLNHMRSPRLPGTVRVLEECEFRNIVIHDGEPALKIVHHSGGRDVNIVLAEISCKTLFNIAPAILHKVHALGLDYERAMGWLYGAIRQLKQGLPCDDHTPMQSERGARDYVAMVGAQIAMADDTPHDQHNDFLMDLFFRHIEYFAKIFFGFITPSREIE